MLSTARLADAELAKVASSQCPRPATAAYSFIYALAPGVM
jgi:hypothetical protein